MVWAAMAAAGQRVRDKSNAGLQRRKSRSRRKDVVVVSLNHRLNILGYLNLVAYGEKYADSTNAGVLDLVAALEWIRDNITAFGGDPGNVTIFGQSGGGAKVSTLASMPMAKGLFHKGVVQSGSTLRLGDAEDAWQAGRSRGGRAPDCCAKRQSIRFKQFPMRVCWRRETRQSRNSSRILRWVVRAYRPRARPRSAWVLVRWSTENM